MTYSTNATTLYFYTCIINFKYRRTYHIFVSIKLHGEDAWEAHYLILNNYTRVQEKTFTCVQANVIPFIEYAAIIHLYRTCIQNETCHRRMLQLIHLLLLRYRMKKVQVKDLVQTTMTSTRSGNSSKTYILLTLYVSGIWMKTPHNHVCKSVRNLRILPCTQPSMDFDITRLEGATVTGFNWSAYSLPSDTYFCSMCIQIFHEGQLRA